MGFINSKIELKFDRSDVLFSDSSSSCGQTYADIESFMKNIGGGAYKASTAWIFQQ